MKIIIYIVLIGFCFNGMAQQLPVFSLYNSNPYVLNPAFAGSEHYWDLTLQHRSQWVGYDNGPSTQLFSSHSRIDGSSSGFGGYFYNDRNGVLGNLGFSGSYAYHLELGEEFQLSFGLAASFTQYKLLGNKVTLNSPTDNLIDASKGKAGAFNTSFGSLFYSENFYFGLSALNLFSPKIDYFSGTTTPLKTHFYMQTGGLIPISANGSIQPAATVNYLSGNPIGIEMQAAYEYVDIIKGGIGYRWKDAISFLFGARLFDGLYLNYAYDLGVSKISKGHSGSHEIMLSYNFYYNPIYKNNKARYNFGRIKRRPD